ncbi:hypothetical protein BDF19DRAFT_466805 [Syncephalis fuscata]|nr:hypothetical protein BDF19DRAFT_466805 [Syncephalis fuscata]
MPTRDLHNEIGAFVDLATARVFIIPYNIYTLVMLMLIFYAIAIVTFYLLAMDATLFLVLRLRGFVGALRPVPNAREMQEERAIPRWRQFWMRLATCYTQDMIMPRLIESNHGSNDGSNDNNNRNGNSSDSDSNDSNNNSNESNSISSDSIRSIHINSNDNENENDKFYSANSNSNDDGVGNTNSNQHTRSNRTIHQFSSEDCIGLCNSPGLHSGPGVIEVATEMKRQLISSASGTGFTPRPSPLSRRLQSDYEWLAWILIISSIVAIAGMLARIVYYFKRNSNCEFGRYWITVCQGVSHAGFMTIVIWLQQHGYGQWPVVFVLQMLAASLTVVSVSIISIPLDSSFNIAGICLYPSTGNVYPHLIGAGFISFSFLMILRVICALCHLPPELESDTDDDDFRVTCLPGTLSTSKARLLMTRFSPFRYYKYLLRKHRQRRHRRFRRTNSFGGTSMLDSQLEVPQHVASPRNLPPVAPPLSDGHSWISSTNINRARRSSSYPYEAGNLFNNSSLPSVFPRSTLAGSVENPVRWISVKPKSVQTSLGTILRHFIKHTILFSDLVTAICMLATGITYSTDVWLHFTNLPIVITWIAICYAALNSFRYWHRRDKRFASLLPIHRHAQVSTTTQRTPSNTINQFHSLSEETGGEYSPDTSSTLEVPIELNGPVPPPRQLMTRLQTPLSAIDATNLNKQLLHTPTGSQQHGVPLVQSPAFSILTLGRARHLHNGSSTPGNLSSHTTSYCSSNNASVNSRADNGSSIDEPESGMTTVANDMIGYARKNDFPGYLPQFDIKSIFKEAEGKTVSAKTLPEQLDALAKGQECVLISFHGAYFPCAAWPSILRFLQRGGNLIAAGGPVFSRPVHWESKDGGYWEIEPETWIYCSQLRLGPFVPIDLKTAAYEEHSEQNETATSVEFILKSTKRAHFLSQEIKSLGGHTLLPVEKKTDQFWSPTPRLSETNVYDGEEGSTGAMDTVIMPLVTVHPVWNKDNPSGQRVATPLLLLDQLTGSFRGGRWLIIPWSRDTSDTTAYQHYLHLIGCCFPLVAVGSRTIDVRAALSCYRIHERPSIKILWQRPLNELSTRLPKSGEKWCIRLTIKAPGKRFKEIFDLTVPLNKDDSGVYDHSLPFEVDIYGLYTITAIYSTTTLPDKKLYQSGGFVTWNADMATSCSKIRPGSHLFLIDNQDGESTEKPWFMFGTTYMDSRVQRHFLHMPNPLRWSRDLSKMRACGINTIRTGLWCGWRDWGINEKTKTISPSTELLRALDAFIMIVSRHKLQIIFNIFAFTPVPAGQHPYLDPKSIDIQKNFGSPQRLWAGRARPNGDVYEKKAFSDWMEQQYQSLDRVRTRWQLVYPEPSSWAQIGAPIEADYSDTVGNTSFRRMLRAADFTRASQHWFYDWASTLATAIRETGCKGMVTVGQDEGAIRPLPLYHSKAVDFTATHPWWNNSDILWDYLMARTPGKPAVAEEVGVMLARDIRGRSFRTEMGNSLLLKRKLYLSLCLGGMIQWLWHTNAYMTSDNECQIGMLRADGSQKPELLIYLEFSDLIEKIHNRWLDNMPESPIGPRPKTPVSPIANASCDSSVSSTNSEESTEPKATTVWLVVLDHQWFARPDLTNNATKMAVRVLSSRFSVLPQLVTEEMIGQLATYTDVDDATWPASLLPRPQIVIVPSAQFLSDAAFAGLKWLTARQIRVHVSGIIERNEDDLPALSRLKHFGIGLADSQPSSIQPVNRYEMVIPLQTQAQFGNESIEFIRKSTLPPINRLLLKNYFSWSGIPVELNDQPDAVTALYAQVFEKAPRKEYGLIVFKRLLSHGHLVVLTNESSRPITYTLNLKVTNGHTQHLLFPLVIASQESGAILVIHDSVNTETKENGAFLFGGVKHQKK